MKKPSTLLIFLSIFVLAIPFAHAQMQPGTIKAFQIKGDVNLIENATGKAVRMKRGMELSQGHSIQTGVQSKALLLFSNGSTVNISENSKVDFVRFLQAPYDKKSKGQYLMLKADPSTSDTLIRLDHGELVGKVKTLQPDSFYDVETPVGSAGVRGTTFLVSFFVSEDGKLMMKVGNLTGRVLLTTKMPAEVTVTESGVAEAEMDPTATLSTGDVPEQSIVLVKANPQDVNVQIDPNIPVETPPKSFQESKEKVQELAKEAENPGKIPGLEPLPGVDIPADEDEGGEGQGQDAPGEANNNQQQGDEGNPNNPSTDTPPANNDNTDIKTEEILDPSPTGAGV